MQYRIFQYVDGDGGEVGTYGLAEQPTVRSIVDAVEQIVSGRNADHFCTGTDPYDGDLVRTIDGWLVVTSNGEGDLYMIHAKEI